MKWNNLYIASIIIGSILAAAPAIAKDPIKKKDIEGTVSSIDADMLEKSTTYTDVGSFLMFNQYATTSNGNRSGVTNNQNLNLYTTNVFRDNLAFNAGLYADRSAWKPESGRNNIERFSKVTAGITYGDQLKPDLAYFAGFNIKGGLNTDKFYSYNGEIFDYEERKTRSGSFGFELFAGLLTQMYDNNNLITRTNAVYDRYTHFYDNYNYTDAELYVEASNVAQIGCTDLYCNRENNGFPVLTDFHKKGTFIYDTNTPIWLGTGTERRAYDTDDIRKWGYLTVGFDYKLTYYPVDNIKVIGGLYANLYSENSRQDDSKSSSNDLGIVFGGGVHAPYDGLLNNVSANLEFDLGRSSNKETNTAGEVSVSTDLGLGIKAYVRYEGAVTSNVLWHLDLGLQRWGYSDANSDYSYNNFGMYAEAGISVPFTSFKGIRY
ncbi:hypothetical protein [Saccharicrinis sp. FJH54]|uniref:hypothetical protein n=1 Tax=Saccharicrinis sp. FJH54 TaxID=3344665 RepID=UPI0035D3DC74